MFDLLFVAIPFMTSLTSETVSVLYRSRYPELWFGHISVFSASSGWRPPSGHVSVPNYWMDRQTDTDRQTKVPFRLYE
jgi:hypothetical protein